MGVVIIDFPEVTDLENADIFYISRGSGPERDKTIKGSTLQNYIGDVNVNQDSTASINLSDYGTNIIIRCDPVADIALTFSGRLPVGKKLLIWNVSTYKVSNSIEGDTIELLENQYSKWISDGTNMVRLPVLFDYVPIGEIKDHPDSSLTNHLYCDGSTIGDVGSGADHESAEYEKLFNILKNKTEYGNAGTEVFASGDTVHLPDFVYESGYITSSVDQATNLGAGDHLQWNQISGNMVLSTGSGQANGLLTLNPYKTYKGECSARVSGTTADGRLGYQAFISGGSAVPASNRALVFAINRTGTNNSNFELASFIYTPTIVTQIEMQIQDPDDIGEIDLAAYAYWFVETPGLSKENTFIRYK